jgi:hypothetical protein
LTAISTTDRRWLAKKAIEDETGRLKEAGKDPKGIGWKSATLSEQLEKLGMLLPGRPEAAGKDPEGIGWKSAALSEQLEKLGMLLPGRPESAKDQG